MLLLDSDSAIPNDGLNTLSSWTGNVLRGDVESSTASHRVDRVGDDIGKHLKQLTAAYAYLLCVVKANLHRNSVGDNLRFIDRQYILDQFADMKLIGRTGVSIVSERLPGDMRDPFQLFFGSL